ncbi:MAG: hypothetical protein ACK5F7_06710, partial [Planctomycetaceae bacterium]
MNDSLWNKRFNKLPPCRDGTPVGTAHSEFRAARIDRNAAIDFDADRPIYTGWGAKSHPQLPVPSSVFLRAPHGSDGQSVEAGTGLSRHPGALSFT